MATFFDSASLVMIPSGYKDDKLYSIKPTDGSGDFTFSRDGAGASPATRVNASGLIEKGRENLLLQSNNFDTTWATSNTSVTSGQTGYDGSSNAWLLSKSDAFGLIEQSISGTAVTTFSLYIKAGTLNWAWIILRDSVGSNDSSTYINLTDGSLGSNGGGAYITAKTESIGGGWYRCSIVSSGGYNQVRIAPADGDGDLTGTSGNIYIQDCQVESGLVATDYIETTTAPVSAGLLGDMPRLDYSGGATCPSLLLEPSRVNSVTQSEYLNGLPDVSNVVVTTNATTSPEGVVNASKVVASAANTFHWIGINTSVSNGIVYTASVFAKAAEYENLFIVLRTDSGAKRYGVKFNIATGTFVDDITFGSPTQTDYDIEDYGNGWYRCSVSSYHTSGNIVALFGPSLGGALSDINNGFLGDGTSGIYMYGTQAENGAYMTSLIPTYGSAAPRGADSCVKTGISSLIGQTEGTIFLETDFTNTSGTQVLLSPHDGAANKRLEIWSNNNVVNGFIGGSVSIAIGNTTISNGVHKMAIAYKSGDSAFYVDGVQVGTSTTAFTISALTTLAFNQYTGLLKPTEGIKQALVFKTRLTNAELAALTTI